MELLDKSVTLVSKKVRVVSHQLNKWIGQMTPQIEDNWQFTIALETIDGLLLRI